MNQNLAVILRQFNYGINSFIVLIPKEAGGVKLWIVFRSGGQSDHHQVLDKFHVQILHDFDVDVGVVVAAVERVAVGIGVLDVRHKPLFEDRLTAGVVASNFNRGLKRSRKLLIISTYISLVRLACFAKFNKFPCWVHSRDALKSLLRILFNECLA